MDFVESLGQQETAEKFAHFWFAGMAKFHRVKDSSTWDFDEQHVIAFLRSKLSTKMPTWKRLKIIEGVIWYRNHVRKSTTPRLEPIRTKLREMIAQERQSQDEDTPKQSLKNWSRRCERSVPAVCKSAQLRVGLGRRL